MGLLSADTNHKDTSIEEKFSQALFVQAFHQHPGLRGHLQHNLHVVEHQVSQGCWLFDGVARPLGGWSLLAPALLSDSLCNHDPLEAESEQPEIRFHASSWQRGGLLLRRRGYPLQWCMGWNENERSQASSTGYTWRSAVFFFFISIFNMTNSC